MIDKMSEKALKFRNEYIDHVVSIAGEVIEFMKENSATGCALSEMDHITEYTMNWADDEFPNEYDITLSDYEKAWLIVTLEPLCQATSIPKDKYEDRDTIVEQVVALAWYMFALDLEIEVDRVINGGKRNAWRRGQS